MVAAQGSTQFDITITANMALALLKLAGRSDPRSDNIDYDLSGAASIASPRCWTASIFWRAAKRSY